MKKNIKVRKSKEGLMDSKTKVHKDKARYTRKSKHKKDFGDYEKLDDFKDNSF